MVDSDSNEDSDWEEVNENDYDIPKFEEDNGNVKEYTQQLDIPTGGIQITVDEGVPAPKSKKFDVEGYVRRAVNRRKKELQEDIHKAHVLCLLSRGVYVNQYLIDEEVLGVALSVLPSKQSYPPKNVDLIYLESFIKWFKKVFKIAPEKQTPEGSGSQNDFKNNLITQINKHEAVDVNYLVYIFISILRALGVHVRLINSLQPLPLKPPSTQLIQDPNRGKKKTAEGLPDNEVANCSTDLKNSSKNMKDTEQKTKSSKISSKRACSEPQSKRAKRSVSQTTPTKSANNSMSSQNSLSDSDSDFDLNRSVPRNRKKSQQGARAESEPSKSRKGNSKSKKVLGKGRKMISSDEEIVEEVKKQKKQDKSRQFIDVWLEVYLEEEERWVSVDLINAKIMCDGDFEAKATQPLVYIVAFGNDKHVKDVTRRYASRWLTGTQKLRVDSKWWQKALRPLLGKRTRRDKEEDELLDQHLMNQPIPASVQEIKNHPLFAMKRHLLKFEAIYPPEPAPLGFIKNEAVYSRDCVKTLHSRELWMRSAKVVRIGEIPYKVVKARPKYDKMTSTVIKDRPLELFGEWQVEDYIPPPAKDGKVPRNDYGNVELFLPKMLPKGTVHLREPGISRIAKKLSIDCAPALVGFDFHSGGSHPTYDGHIVCEEFKDLLLDAWREDHEESMKREEAKRRKRVLGNWKRLIRMLQAQVQQMQDENQGKGEGIRSFLMNNCNMDCP
ncbi:unnamed protein product [Allacma fusca]|uniref:Uncharacterized protein n=1 Tax=Allacma fusca TaxID=39272 RepID=A0A8J2JJ07_9HEXA|nr:unnamed protein product [Allacma fusca]